MAGSLADRIENVRRRGSARRLALVLAFWLFTYLVMTTRAALVPDLPFEVVYPKRIVTTGTGALCLWWLGAALEVRRDASLGARLGFAACATLGSALLLLALRLTWSALVPEADAPSDDEARWVLTWTGYFLGAVGIHQAIDLTLTRAASGAMVAPGDAPVESPYPADLRVSRNQSLVLVPVSGIRWFEADGNYVQVMGAGGSEGWLRSSMRALAAELDPAQFVRLHRSIICARRIVRGVRRKPSGALVALLDDGAELPVGRAHAPAVLAMLGIAETSVPEERRSSPDAADA